MSSLFLQSARYKIIADEVGALIRVKEINPQEKYNFSRITINDFYNIEGKIYFGEMTLYPSGG
ncbi:hypothetical protein [Salinicoccus roseus]|uniref:hypothetical protein n=1 Tax=Salinicoccus roseus TaxID=45670 RepID=UPI000F50CDDD|nr:hypothetical protein [Salinicoccus roseus]GGA62743.1 hypothetical protein GCM10007176_04010 [Salinicoccus roseus]